MSLTLLIDGNWLALSRMAVLTKGFQKSNPDIVKQETAKEFKELLAKSISIILNRFNCIDNIILISDGGSWRKSLPIPKCLEVTYKGNRGKTFQELDFDVIFGSFGEFISHCKEIGITCSSSVNCEGDDWVWYWSRRLNSQGINTMIWSSDNDLKQLVQKDSCGAVTVWYNDKNGLFLHNSLNEDISDLDFFLKGDPTNPIIQELNRVTKTPPHYINPDDIVLSKVFCGDSGDNIKSIVRYNKKGRTYNFSSKDFEKVSNELQIHSIQDLLTNYANISNYVIQMKKFSPYDIKLSDVFEMLVYNTKLVWLNESMIPDTVIQQMNNCEYKRYDISNIKHNYKLLLEEDDSILNIFEGIS